MISEPADSLTISEYFAVCTGFSLTESMLRVTLVPFKINGEAQLGSDFPRLGQDPFSTSFGLGRQILPLDSYVDADMLNP